MAFNLLDARWIPARRASGTVERISPWQITDGSCRRRLLDVTAMRPDLDGALLEFLIGFVQTVMTPGGEDEWFDRWETPPTPNELRVAAESIHEAFDLDGDGPRFMQDRDAPEPGVELRPIAWLFMDAPSENTEKENRDLFIKRRGFSSLCPGCAAAALFTLQTFASSGGRGHYSSLRGKGPLSTLVLGEDLWHTVWANILNRSQLNAHGKPSSTVKFPWLPLRGRTAVGPEVVPGMVHPVYRFWGMPRRIRLIFEDVATPCGLCGELSKTAATNYVTRPNGNKYQGPWRHPLTPYRIQADNNPFPVEAAVDGAGYRHWLGLTLGQKSGKVTVEPAHVVRAFAARCKDLDGDRPGFRVRAYGYDMENMKARGFCYGEMPAWILPDAKLRNAFAFEVQRLVSAADQAAWTLKKAVFDAFIHEKRGGRQRTGLASRKLFVMFSARFWAVTEPKFYAMLPEVHQAVRDRGETFPIRQAWRRQLETAAMDLFEEATAAAGSGGGDIKRVAKAQRALRFAVGPWSKEMQKRLDLPPPTPAGEAKEEETLA